MKTTVSIIILCASLAASRGDIVKFNISPAGTDAAIGLSPLNETPSLTNSTGSGNAISGGIVLQTTNGMLHFAIGYGAAAGFTDLTGAATGFSLHGPATTNGTAPVLFDLRPFSFPAATPTNGGILFGTLTLTSNQVSSLLAGMDYVQIATSANTNGEIRGQLIPAPNTAPILICPPDETVECTGQPIMLTAAVADPDGDALKVVWTVNGMNVQTNHVPAGNATKGVEVVLAAHLALGTNIVGVAASDTSSNVTSCSSTIVVRDTIPPLISSATATPASLWPPNHNLIPISVKVNATDICCGTTWKIISVTSNEPVGSGHDNGNNGHGNGSGNTAPDWVITGDHSVSLRSEREGGGHGRVYTITVQAKDCAGNLSLPSQ